MLLCLNSASTPSCLALQSLTVRLNRQCISLQILAYLGPKHLVDSFWLRVRLFLRVFALFHRCKCTVSSVEQGAVPCNQQVLLHLIAFFLKSLFLFETDLAHVEFSFTSIVLLLGEQTCLTLFSFHGICVQHVLVFLDSMPKQQGSMSFLLSWGIDFLVWN